MYEKEVCYYYGSPYGHPTGNERVRKFIDDFLVSGNYLVGGYKLGFPPQIPYSYLYNDNASEIRQLIIPGSSVLNDGRLDPGEVVLYREIFDYFGSSSSCGVGFQVTVPAGLLAVIACGGSCAPFATLLSSISLSLEYSEGGDTEIGGHIKNCGSDCQASGGYDVSEFLYMRISLLKYHVGSCEYDIPVAMYFRSD